MTNWMTHRLRMLLPLIAVAALATGAAALDAPVAAPKKQDQKAAAAKAAAKSKIASKKAHVATKRKASKSSIANSNNPKSKSAATAAAPTAGAVKPAVRATLASAIATDPVPAAFAAPSALAPEDTDAVKRAMALARRGKTTDATEIEKTIRDPAARKLVEWFILRSEDNGVDFDRYAAFLRYNPSWPSVSLLRRRAEGALWHERRDAATVRAFFAGNKPLSAKGRFALARILQAQGERAAAEALVREGWHADAFSEETEAQVREEFPGVIARADEKARMHRRLYAKDYGPALRAANRLGGSDAAIVKAYAAVATKSTKAEPLLDAVAADARHDAGYMLARMNWLMRKDRVSDAGRVALAAPRDAAQIQDADEWWRQRRVLVRKLLDAGDTRTAYQVARDAAVPTGENYRADHHFTAGWIALRFLNEPSTAAAHFARIAQGITNPIALARAGYWQGRAAEALGRHQEARAHFDAAARYPTAYYGQLARAKLGIGEITLRRPPALDTAQRAAIAHLEVVRATEILYALGERDLVIPIVADLAERAFDIATLVGLAELTARHGDARPMLLLGKAALARGYAFDHYAFPSVGVPRYASVAPEIDRSLAFAIVRQESEFNQRDVSPAQAVGLMQVTPAAGRDTAKRFGINYDWKRLVSDPIYNTQMGAAELAGLLQDYRGSYILTFAGYNAGRGRVREWIERFGDPRDQKVDPIDWVERIPFAETRNYVQRVMENMQVYRVRFGGSTPLTIEADLRKGAN